tara:strand:- start:298 stop:474 length:177 start_codon:yes stop_codon:yes gene_type:complete
MHIDLAIILTKYEQIKQENDAVNSLLVERDEEIATLKKKIQHLENNMQGTYRPVKGKS